jgi:sulfate adenylyltransferase subunit 2
LAPRGFQTNRNEEQATMRVDGSLLAKGQTARVFPFFNWTKTNIRSYALLNTIKLAPLYYATPHPVVERSGAFVGVYDESRIRFQPGGEISTRTVLLRALGCWPVTSAIESDATDLTAVVDETLRASSSERQCRIGDREDGGSLEWKKREGYF